MKAHLLFADGDSGLAATWSPRTGYEVSGPDLAPVTDDLVHDLDLGAVFDAMGGGDPFLAAISTRVLLASLHDPAAIRYRQDVLADCLARPRMVRGIYSLADESIRGVSKFYRSTFETPVTMLQRSIEMLEFSVNRLRLLRGIAAEHSAAVSSTGFRTLFSTLVRELDDQYLHGIEDHLQRLRFRGGVPISASLGRGLKGRDYRLLRPEGARRSLRERVGMERPGTHSFELSPRDELGTRALGELASRGVERAADALMRASDHITSFFTMLCIETGFYVACLNLHDVLAERGAPTCVPVVEPPGGPALSFEGLIDLSLALREEQPVVGNDAVADDSPLIVITGANSGGKSTFLRSLGIALLAAQSGMFVCAASFTSSLCRGIFTHFGREEDPGMTMGKLDEELARVSTIARSVTSRSLVLFNEPFATTNEREGSEIGRQIITALLENGIRVAIVTHLHTLACTLVEAHGGSALSLRAERGADGRRTFKLVAGEPLPTSYGGDLYRRMGGWPRGRPRVDSPSGRLPTRTRPTGEGAAGEAPGTR
jgi:hypothetical protein